MIQTLVTWGPAAIWAAVLFLLSETEPGSAGVWSLVNDKVAHLGIYGILGSALAWGGLRTRRKVSPLVLVLAGTGYGALDEWHQSFVPGRTPSLGDLVADAGGVALGILLVHLFLGDRIRPSSPDSD